MVKIILVSLVVVVIWVFIRSIIKMIIDNKPVDLTKMRELLNKELPLPDHKPTDLSYLDRMKRNRKYKAKVVVRTAYLNK
jgi:hypothetical protein